MQSLIPQQHHHACCRQLLQQLLAMLLDSQSYNYMYIIHYKRAT